MKFKSLILAASALAISTAAAVADGHIDTPAVTGKFKGEIYLMDAQKMTLYTFDKDKRNVSNCNDECAAKWPPLTGEVGMDLPGIAKLFASGCKVP